MLRCYRVNTIRPRRNGISIFFLRENLANSPVFPRIYLERRLRNLGKPSVASTSRYLYVHPARHGDRNIPDREPVAASITRLWRISAVSVSLCVKARSRNRYRHRALRLPRLYQKISNRDPRIYVPLTVGENTFVLASNKINGPIYSCF